VTASLFSNTAEKCLPLSVSACYGGIANACPCLLTRPSELRCYSRLVRFSREITRCVELSLGTVIARRQRDVNAMAGPEITCGTGFECLDIYI
jgi:hypothetical protein